MAALDFKNSIALVTGASSGIGRQVALDFAARGATVVASSRALARLDETAEALKRCGGASEVVECDVSDAAAVKRMVSGALAKFGRVDILVNNVGKAGGGDIVSTPDAEWQSAFDQTLFPAIRMSRLAVPMFNTMYADREGNIWYVYYGAVPKRDPKYDWSKFVDGSDPDAEWVSANIGVDVHVVATRAL